MSEPCCDESDRGDPCAYGDETNDGGVCESHALNLRHVQSFSCKS